MEIKLQCVIQPKDYTEFWVEDDCVFSMTNMDYGGNCHKISDIIRLRDWLNEVLENQ